jgi:uncharacterized membrane protein YjjB (DUF3815 family)
MLSDFFYASMAAMFFAFLFNVPKISIPITALLGGIGYVVFLIVGEQSSSQMFGFFIGTTVITILSEIAARIMKLATTIFVSIAIIPLVPGLGLYKTMLFIVQNNYELALSTGIQTMSAAGTMAMAIAITTLLYRFIINLIAKINKSKVTI